MVMESQGDEPARELLPPDFNARTRVHEYGGGALAFGPDRLFAVNDSDQQVYLLTPGGTVRQLTHTPGRRFADLEWSPSSQTLVAVCEDHTGTGEPTSSIVTIDPETGALKSLVHGADFYAAPRTSPDGGQLAWLTWNHPNMPWDNAEVWVGTRTNEGLLGNMQRVAGGLEEAAAEPRWSPDGTLYLISDRSDWWNVYRWDGQQVHSVTAEPAEFTTPHWVFGIASYAFLSAESAVCAYQKDGTSHLMIKDLATGVTRDIALPYTSVTSVHADGGRVVFIGGGPDRPSAIVVLDSRSGEFRELETATDLPFDTAYLALPHAVTFPTAENRTAHGLFYEPTNPRYAAPPGELPPLVVKVHGGPTSSTSSSLRLDIQYYTSRGVAVLDVNYGGSTGYGRAYRNRLRRAWGVVDVDDCCNGALFLADSGRVDRQRMAITGGSAGGYTTLACLAFRDVFSAGASHYGVSDCEALAMETHKFESRYLDQLIGAYPEEREIYKGRSPIHSAHKITCPVVFFQGLEDKIVPPNQATMMVDALRSRQIPVALLEFEGEQHGFRQASNICRALEGELYFFSRVFSFPLADDITPVRIDNA
mgnify:FL=1